MPEPLAGNLETILVVDDNEVVLMVVVGILKAANFQVLSANNGAEAIELVKEAGRLDMLLSDVDMPGISGPDLGETLKKSRPDLRVMLMSGGMSGNLLVLNYGWAFIQKPFLPARLVEMIMSALHSPDRSQFGGHEFNTSKDQGGK